MLYKGRFSYVKCWARGDSELVRLFTEGSGDSNLSKRMVEKTRNQVVYMGVIEVAIYSSIFEQPHLPQSAPNVLLARIYCSPRFILSVIIVLFSVLFVSNRPISLPFFGIIFMIYNLTSEMFHSLRNDLLTNENLNYLLTWFLLNYITTIENFVGYCLVA